jgi:hypothetical protein
MPEKFGAVAAEKSARKRTIMTKPCVYAVVLGYDMTHGIFRCHQWICLLAGWRKLAPDATIVGCFQDRHRARPGGVPQPQPLSATPRTDSEGHGSFRTLIASMMWCWSQYWFPHDVPSDDTWLFNTRKRKATGEGCGTRPPCMPTYTQKQVVARQTGGTSSRYVHTYLRCELSDQVCISRRHRA